MREKLFSVTRKDFRIDYFRAGGNGGQKQNKTNSGCRITHIASGAVGEGRDTRDQAQNRKNAFLRCVNSPKFQSWLRMEIARYNGAEKRVEEAMHPRNIKTEIRIDGRWTEVDDL